MTTKRKSFYQTVIGAISFSVVTIGLQAASHELHRNTTATVATLNDRDYKFVVSQTPVNPNDHMNSLGIHSDGYYYNCSVLRQGLLVSSFVVRRQTGFHAREVTITPHQFQRERRVMAQIDIVPDSGNAVVADCIISPPASDDRYGAGIFDWRAFDISGM